MTLFYLDISSAQSGISLKGANAVCVKATQGGTYVNPDYTRAMADAAANGVFAFAYHFLMAGNAAAQAGHCFNVVRKTPIMVDVELTTGSKPTLADVQEFVDAFRKLGGVINLVYLPHWYWFDDLHEPSLNGLHSRGLRVVSSAYTTYSDADTAPGWEPYGGMTPTIWQYTSSQKFNGFSVDFNAFRGTHPGDSSAGAIADTLKQFKSIVRTGKMPPIIPVPKRHVVPAGNGYTLEGAARELKTTVGDIVDVSDAHLDAKNQAVFNAYLTLDQACAAAGLNRPAMPEGLVYWTAN